MQHALRGVVVGGWLMFVMSLFAVGVIAQEDDPAGTQAALDAAVQELFAQTEQAGQPHITATVAAAFEAAQTATAEAPAGVESEPDGLSADEIEVVDQFEYPLLAGPVRTSAFLSPDGETFLYISGREFCLYPVGDADPLLCNEIPEEIPDIEVEQVTWSPNSRYVAFHNDVFRTFRDPDIWLFDAADGSFIGVTEDEALGLPPFDEVAPASVNVDFSPRWLPDGRLVFLRVVIEGDERSLPQLTAIDIETDEIETLGVLPVEDGFSVTRILPSPDGTQIAYDVPRFGDGDSGIGVYDLTTGEGRFVARNNQQAGLINLLTLGWSPDGQYLLVFDTGAFAQFTPSTGHYVFVVDVNTRQTIQLAESFASEADVFAEDARVLLNGAWLPDGGLVLLGTNRGNQMGSLFVTSEPGGKLRLITEAQPLNPPTSIFMQGLTFADNNRVLLSQSPDEGIVIYTLGIE